MIELPKDAYGRKIPLDTEVLYDKHGVEFDVKNFEFYKAPSSQEGEWLVSGIFNDDTDDSPIMPKFLCITPPDSWEKLEEDLGRAAERDAVVSCCRYFTADKCADCPIRGNTSGCLHKEELAFGDILNRIRKLRGED